MGHTTLFAKRFSSIFKKHFKTSMRGKKVKQLKKMLTSLAQSEGKNEIDITKGVFRRLKGIYKQDKSNQWNPERLNSTGIQRINE